MASQTPIDMGQEEAAPADEPPAAGTFRRINDGIGRVEIGLLAVLILILIASAIFEVVDPKATWSDELTRYTVFFVAMAGLALAAQRQGMFHMDLVTRLFPPRFRAGLRIATAVLVVGLCGLVIKYALIHRANSYEVIQDHEVISTGNGYLALVAGFTLVAIHFVLHALVELMYLTRGKLPPEPPHGGH
ncbi:MAG TPA: TRAP transporter small permease subunit [Kofleriaceae bacterium]|nr:TRAP transporter small permease subunit [Kofleriaceae bacterium]